MLKRKFFLLAAMCLAFFQTACSSGGSPEQAAERFVEKSYAGDAKAVIEMIYLPNEDKHQAGMVDMVNGKIKAGVAKQAEYAESLGGVAEIKSEAADIQEGEPKRANVKVLVRFKQDGQEKRDNVRLIETHKGWKVRL